MKVAIVATNMIRIHKGVKKGTEIFVYIFVKALQKHIEHNKLDIDVTTFASGNSDFPTKINSINMLSSLEDKEVGMERHKTYEMALISKAFAMQDQFDLFHIHLSNGEWVLPFLHLVKKPVLITMHGGTPHVYAKKYFALFKNIPNVYYVSISNSQRKQLRGVNYVKTIYHGINATRVFKFDADGGDSIIWAGRGIPDKGLTTVLEVVKKTKKKSMIFPILKEEYLDWFRKEVLRERNRIRQEVPLAMDFDLTRSELVEHYQKAKLFLSPITWEEPFGLVMIESMSTGTPVVAYARGSVPEVIKDGVTGFIVNESDDDIRGDFIIKKTGVAGLCEAVERIYAMSKEDYLEMRLACRRHVELNFTVERMVKKYVNLYNELV